MEGINNFSDIISTAKLKGPRTVAVAYATDNYVLEAVELARTLGLVRAILIGPEKTIIGLLKEINAPPGEYEIENEDDKVNCCNKAVAKVREGRADLIMKGMVDTAVILRSVLDKEKGIRREGLISHVNVVKTSVADKLLVISDTAVNISPSLDEKIHIIKNASIVAHALGINRPRVAMICPVEKVSEKIESTVHAAKITEMNRKDGTLSDCIISGPLALDIAISPDAAKHKGILYDPVAGNADILITANLDAGNILIKTLEHFTSIEKSGITMGASVPVVLTSRSSSGKVKLNSIALSVLVSNYMKKGK